MKREVFKVNQKAPRMGKKEFSTQVFTKEIYEKFKKVNPEYGNMDWKTFQQHWADITETIRNQAITNPLGVKLGYYLGELKFQFLPYKFKATDMKTSNEIEQEVNHLNIITRGKVAKIKWERRWAVKFLPMLQFYAFEPDRRMNQISKDYLPKNVDKIRVSRNTLGGSSAWK